MSVGVFIASTGGKKTLRTIKSFQKMEPDYPIHLVIDISSRSWNTMGKEWEKPLQETGVKIRYTENRAHINGTLNAGMRWLRELGFSHACFFHDDLIFSPFPKHKLSVSRWFTPGLLKSSGITFGHFEAFALGPDSGGEPYARRHPTKWDALDLENEALWNELMVFEYNNGFEIRPTGVDWYCRYEGPDKVRPWNRLGPTGQVIPISTWEANHEFDETVGVHYDQDYTMECFRRKCPPVWAVPNVPWLHLHNQTMAPWGDPAPEPWGRTESMIQKYGANWPGFWQNDWEERWLSTISQDAINESLNIIPGSASV